MLVKCIWILWNVGLIPLKIKYFCISQFKIFSIRFLILRFCDLLFCNSLLLLFQESQLWLLFQIVNFAVLWQINVVVCIAYSCYIIICLNSFLDVHYNCLLKFIVRSFYICIGLILQVPVDFIFFWILIEVLNNCKF